MKPDNEIGASNLSLTESKLIAQSIKSSLDVINIYYYVKRKSVILEVLKSSNCLQSAYKNKKSRNKFTRSRQNEDGKLNQTNLNSPLIDNAQKSTMTHKYNFDNPLKESPHNENIKRGYKGGDNFFVSDFKFPGSKFLLMNKQNYCELFFDGTATRKRRKSTRPVSHRKVDVVKPIKSDSNINMMSSVPLKTEKTENVPRKRVYRMKDTLVDHFKQKFRSSSPKSEEQATGKSHADLYKSASSKNDGEICIEIDRNDLKNLNTSELLKSHHKKHRHPKIILTANTLKLLNKTLVKNAGVQTDTNPLFRELLDRNISIAHTPSWDLPKGNYIDKNDFVTVSNLIFSTTGMSYSNLDCFLQEPVSEYVKKGTRKCIKGVNLEMIFHPPVVIKAMNFSEYNSDNSRCESSPKRPQMPRRFIGKTNPTEKSTDYSVQFNSCFEDEKETEAFEDKHLKTCIAKWLELVKQIDIEKMNKNRQYYKSVCGLIKNCSGFISKLNSNFIPELTKRCEKIHSLTDREQISQLKKDTVRKRIHEKNFDNQSRSSSTLKSSQKCINGSSPVRPSRTVKFQTHKKPRSKCATPENDVHHSPVSNPDKKPNISLNKSKMMEFLKQFAPVAPAQTNSPASAPTKSEKSGTLVHKLEANHTTTGPNKQVLNELIKYTKQKTDPPKTEEIKSSSTIPKRESSSKSISNKYNDKSTDDDKLKEVNKSMVKFNTNAGRIAKFSMSTTTSSVTAEIKDNIAEVKKKKLSIMNNKPIEILKQQKKLEAISTGLSIMPNENIEADKVEQQTNTIHETKPEVNHNEDCMKISEDIDHYFNDLFDKNAEIINDLKETHNKEIVAKSTRTSIRASKIPINTKKLKSTATLNCVERYPNSKKAESVCSGKSQQSKTSSKNSYEIPIKKIIEKRLASKLSSRTKKLIASKNYNMLDLDSDFIVHDKAYDLHKSDSKKTFNSSNVDFNKSFVSQGSASVLKRAKTYPSKRELMNMKTPAESVDSKSTITVRTKSDSPRQGDQKRIHGKLSSSPGSINNSSILFTKVNTNNNQMSSFQRRKEYYRIMKNKLNKKLDDDPIEEWRHRDSDLDNQKLKQKCSQNYTKKIDHSKENSARIHNTFFTSIEDAFARKKGNRQSVKYPNLTGLLSFTNDPTNAATQPLQKIDNKPPNMPEQNKVFTIMSCNYPDQIDPFMHIFKIFETKNLFNKCDIHMIYSPAVSERDCARNAEISPIIREIKTEDVKHNDLLTDNLKSGATKPTQQPDTTANAPIEQPIEAKPSCSARVVDDQQDMTEVKNKPLKRFKYFPNARLDNNAQMINLNKKKLNKLSISPPIKHDIFSANSAVDEKIKEHNNPALMTDLGNDSNIANKDSSRTILENQTTQDMSATLRELMNYISEKTETNPSSNFSSLGNIDTFCEINEEHLNRLLHRLKMEEKSKCKDSPDDLNSASFPSGPFVKLINKIYETNKFFTEHFSYGDDENVNKPKSIPTEVPSHNIPVAEYVNRYEHTRNYASDTSECSNQGDDFKPKTSTLNKVINMMKQREKNINGDLVSNEDFDRTIKKNYEDDNSIDLSNTSKNSFDDLPIEELLSDKILRTKRNKLKSFSSTTADKDLLSNSHVTFMDPNTTLSEMKCKNETINVESSYSSASFALTRTSSNSLSTKLSQIFNRKKKKKIPKKRLNI